MQAKQVKQQWFNTLAEALESEGLEGTFPASKGGLQYGEAFGYTFDDGSRYGRFIRIYRSEQGLYEIITYLR